MGCATSTAKISEEEKKSINLVPVEIQEIGLLKVTIQLVKEINKFEQFYSENSNFIQLSLCNQKFITPLSYDPIIKETLNTKQTNMEFVINQLEVQKCLEVKVYSEFGENEQIKTAEGNLVLKEDFFKTKNDEDPSKNVLKIGLISEKDVNVGWVTVSLEFIPFKYDILIVRLNSVTLRNETKSGREIYVNIKIGGEEYETHTLKSSEKKIPSWENAVYGFIVPEFLSYGKLSVYSKNEENDFHYLLGELAFNPRVVLESDELQTYVEEIEMKGKVIGSVCMQFLKTKNVIPEIPVIENPKRIKYVQKLELEEVEKYTRQVFNYLSKKSSKTTNCTSKNSIEKEFLNNLNKKPEELEYFNMYLPECRKNININNEQIHRRILENSEYFFDKLRCKKTVEKEIEKENSQLIYENHHMERVFSDAELSFTIDIPETSSKLIEQINSRNTQNDVSSLRESRISRKDSVNKRKEGSIKVSRDSSLYKENNGNSQIEETKLENREKFTFINQTNKIYFKSNEEPIVKIEEINEFFTSIPDEIFSNSVCVKNESILENESQNKSEFFSNSLSERSNQNEKPENRFSNEIKAMESINKKILCNLDQNECKNFSKNNKTIKINIPQEEIYYGEENSSRKENENIEPNYDFDGFDIKLSSIISKKMNNCEPVIV